MRKVLSVFIAVCLVLSLFTGVFAPVPSAKAESEGGFTYALVGTAPNQTATITGYTFTGWSGGATGTSISTTITMDADKTVTASFAGTLGWQVSAYVPGDYGTLTPATQDVADGGTATVVISPAVGYHLESLTDNGHAVSPLPSSTYVIPTVGASHVIGAVFSQDGISDTVRIAIGYPNSLFPLISSSADTAFAAGFLMAGPVGVNPRGVLYGDLCSTVPTLENGDLVRNLDGTIITTVRLRPGLKWSDGQPLNIDDYIFSYALSMSSAIQVVSRSPMDLVTSIVRIDDLTCRVYWKSWDPYIPIGWSIYPKHILGPIFDANPAAINTCDYALYPISAGPYVLESRVVGQSMTFVANPFYWQPGKPIIPRVIARAVDPNNLVDLMKSGEIDVSSETLPLDLAHEFEWENGTSFNVYYNPGTTAGIMEWNLTSPWFSDKRVRQAFYYGIDRTYITVQAMVGTNAVRSPLFAGSVYFKPVLDTYTYSPATANALLDAAGWTWNAGHTQRILPDSTPAVLTISYAAGATFRENEVNLIRPMLALLGITVVNGPMDFNTMLYDLTHGTFTVALHGIGFDNYDAFGSVLAFRSGQIPTAVNGWSGQNNSRYNSPEMDTWINAAQNATTTSALTDAYTHIQDIFGEDLPCLYLEQRVYPDVVRKGLLGYDHFFSSTVYCNWNIQDWSWTTHSLTVNTIGSGSVAKSPDQPSYDPDTIVTLTATPSSGYTFTGWTGATPVSGHPDQATITMDGDKTVTATFSPALVLSASWNLVSVAVSLPVASIPGLQLVFGYHDRWTVLGSTSSLIRGEAYWVQVENAVTVPLPGTPSTAPVSLPYEAGWQLLGNPFDVPLLISTIANHELITACYSYSYDPGWGVLNPATDSLQPGKGYWIDLLAPTILTLTYPWD